jgi:hypothetical protein
MNFLIWRKLCLDTYSKQKMHVQYKKNTNFITWSDPCIQTIFATVRLYVKDYTHISLVAASCFYDIFKTEAACIDHINKFYNLALKVFRVFIRHIWVGVRARKYKLFDLAQVMFRGMYHHN